MDAFSGRLLLSLRRDRALRLGVPQPVATKRVRRSVLMASDGCASDPEWAARFLADLRDETRYPDRAGVDEERVVHPLSPRQRRGRAALPCTAWLHEAGMLKSTPQ